MSLAEDNPFQQSPENGVQGAQPNPSSTNKGCLIGCAVAAMIGGLICCGGIAFLASKGSTVFSDMVNEAIAAQVRSSLSGEPSIEAQVGEVESLEFDFTLTFEEAQKANQAGQETPLVFRIQGSKGSGKILILQDPNASEELSIKSGTLIMEDGSEYPLDMESVDVESLKSTASGNPDLSSNATDPEPTDPEPTDLEATDPETTDLETTGAAATGESNQDAPTDPDELESESTEPAETDPKAEQVQSDGGGQ